MNYCRNKKRSNVLSTYRGLIKCSICIFFMTSNYKSSQNKNESINRKQGISSNKVPSLYITLYFRKLGNICFIFTQPFFKKKFRLKIHFLSPFRRYKNWNCLEIKAIAAEAKFVGQSQPLSISRQRYSRTYFWFITYVNRLM